jgi:hypothetical protein
MEQNLIALGIILLLVVVVLFQHVQKGRGTTGDEPEAVLRRI